ncbi:MAG: AAA-like domain-containing protein [Actinomycetota bacterium]|nr:AAA-like domain-containing protein [Actinomycetota bacterium]
MTSAWNQPSPFIFDGPLPPDELTGRTDEAETLRAWARAGRSTALVAPRRFGKTSLIGRLAADAEQQDAMPTVTVDLYEVASLADFVIRLERAWARHAPQRLRRRIAEVFAGAQVGLSLVGTGFTVRLAERPDTDPLPALHTLLDLPLQLAGKEDRVLIVFDEFQSLAGVPGAEALLRSHAQHQRTSASYLFAGSEPGMIAAAFDRVARPFYGQVERFRLGRLPAAALAERISRGFAENARSADEVLGDVIAISERHPQRSMLLAHLLFARTPPGGRASAQLLRLAVDDALDRVDPEARAVLSGLEAGERKALRATAEYGSPLSSRAAHVLDLPKSTAQGAARKLVDVGLLEREDRTWRVVDPLLARWLRREYALRA